MIDSTNNTKPGIIILNKDPGSFERLWKVVQVLREQLDKYQVIYINSHGRDQEKSLYLYRDYQPSNQPAYETAQAIRTRFDIEPVTLYQSDLGFVGGYLSEEAYLDRTLFTLTEADRIFRIYNVRYLFMTGGGTMFSNAFFEWGMKQESIQCHRIHPLFYFNIQPDSFRYFFTDNNAHCLPPGSPSDLNTPRFQRALKHAREYVQAVQQAKLKPDQFSRKAAREKTFTPDIGGAIKSYGCHLANLLLHGLGRPANIRQHRGRYLAYIRKRYLDLTRRALPSDERYFLCVLHHPFDSQLLLRARQFIDQVALCRLLAANMPYGIQLYIKEHPVQPGMLPIKDLRMLKRKYPHIRFVDYSIPFSELIHQASGVITINSTAGLEAMIHGVPVITLGDGFYGDESFVHRVRDFSELTDVFKTILAEPKSPTQEQVVDLLARLLYESEPEPGDYVDDISKCLSDGILRRISPN